MCQDKVFILFKIVDESKFEEESGPLTRCTNVAVRFLKPFPVFITRMCTSKGPTIADLMKWAVRCIGSGWFDPD